MHREMTSELRHEMHLDGCVGGSSVRIENARWIAGGFRSGADLLSGVGGRAEGGR